ncbi:MAG: CHAD domain-containing protein [Planctomycetes bacterium]|nr:CHAD domain-containing protein [Planctomycetota bacterium]
MAYRLRRKESLEEAIRRIAAEQIDKALAEIEDKALDRVETVHQVRKRCKKLRGLLRLARPEFENMYQRENACFRDAARTLSAARDADVLIETLSKLAEHFKEQTDESSVAGTRAALERNRRQRLEENGDLSARLEQFTETMREARRRSAAWSLNDGGFSAIAGGVEKTYRRGRRAMRAAYADPTAERFHEWRRRAKYHGYHMRLLRNLWKPEMTVRREACDEFSDLLGDEHDLAVLRATLQSGNLEIEDDRDVEALIGLIDRRRVELHAAARPIGERLFAEKPSCLIQRFKGYWGTWKKKAGQGRLARI